MKENILKTIKHTLPICFSYIFLGIAFGISLSESGHQGALYSFLSSTFVFAGSMQFMMIEFLAEPEVYSYFLVAVFTVIINMRYAVYGLTFTEHYKDVSWYKKWYFVYTLSDETYSVLVATSVPFEHKNHTYDFLVHFANHLYWIIGCVLGSLLGSLISIDLTGIDFVMTAMFVCIFVERLMNNENKLPAIIALTSAIVSLIIMSLLGVGTYFIMPAIILAITFLFVFRNKIERTEEDVVNE